ncbi:MAG: TatD family hydrolase [Desulfobacterales bacterium]|nr:TatD family hydrolase [Desulfobacterales bacterium]
MILFDSHSHLDDKSYDTDRDDVILRAAQAQVKEIMVVGIDLDSSRKAVEIAQKYPNIITSVGYHPHYAKNCSKDTIHALIGLARTQSCVKAWGETGLDFNRMFSPRMDQETCLIRQLEAAGDLDLPLIFHERDTGGRFYELVKAHGPRTRKGVVHCFSGTKQEMVKYLDLGYHIGITGILTIKKRGAYLRSIVPMIPDDRLLIETDCPYLTPAPQKNKVRRNEPGFVKSVLLKLAEVRQTDPEQLSEIIYKNTKRFYGIDRPDC